MQLLRLLPRFREAGKALAELAEHEAWSRSQIEDFQLDQLNALWRHAVEHVPHYRRLFAEGGLPTRFSSLEEYAATVPILDKHYVRRNPGLLLSEGCLPGSWHYTGGSTGAPTKVYWSKTEHIEALRAKYRFYAIWGVDILDRTVFLWGHEASFPPGLLGQVRRMRQPIEDFLRNRIRLSVYDLGEARLQGYLRRMQAFRPAMLYGYSAALYMLALAALAAGYRLESLKIVVPTAEAVPRNLVDTIQRAFGVPAPEEYGSVECGLIAYEDADRRLRAREDKLIVETIPGPAGHYRVIVSSLGNHSFPLLRYEIGDLADSALAVPTTGFACLGQIVGRNNEFLVCKSGHLMHPQVLPRLIRVHASVRRYVAHQSTDGKVTIVIDSDSEIAPADVTEIERIASAHLEGYPVEVRQSNDLPSTIGGKHRWIVSELAQVRGYLLEDNVV